MAGHYFRGNGLSLVDPKGRLSVPASFRAVIEARGGGKEIVIGRHQSEPCLVGYDAGYQDKLDADNERVRAFEEQRGDLGEHHQRERNAFMHADSFGWDGSGRIILSNYLKKKAALDGYALFVGAGQTFEIWSLKAAMESSDERLRELAEFYVEDREIAL